jgi:hypothetical protein
MVKGEVKLEGTWAPEAICQAGVRRAAAAVMVVVVVHWAIGEDVLGKG